MKLILISGKLQSGKNTVADHLSYRLQNDGYSVHQDALANALKEMCEVDFKPLAEVLNGVVDDLLSEIDVPELAVEIIKKLRISTDNWYENKNDITRALLQIYGTNIFRCRFDQNYWVNLFIKKLSTIKADYVILTDVRFLNEIENFITCGYEVVTIRVNRQQKNLNNHPSETALDNFINWNFVVENDGSIEELHKKVDEIIPQI